MKGEDKMKNALRFINGEDVDCFLNSPILWGVLFLWFALLLIRDMYQLISFYL